MGAGGERRGVGWSATYLIMSRVSTLAAVPVLVGELGVDLYAVWVLATTFIFAQGLVDFGWSAAVVRFAALGKAHASRSTVLTVLFRGSIFYGVLSIAAVVAWIAAPEITDWLPYLSHDEVEHAVVILRYTAVAFAATNVTLLLGATLQGLGRVDAAYRAKTIGAAAYLPLLIVGMQLVGPWDAAGISIVGMYGVEMLLAALVLVPELRRTGDNAGEPPPVRAMFRTGIQWQVSSWADFATFQLPRILAAVGGTSRSVLIVDLALRYGQAITTPLFAFYPVVLPAAATVWVEEGMTGVARLVQRYLRGATPVFLVGAALLIPMAAPAIEVWAGVSVTISEAAAAMAVGLGMVVYASTGIFSAVLLAIDDLGDVMRYKTAQLLLAAVLVTATYSIGAAAVAGALTVALVGPASWFNARAAGVLGVRFEAAAGAARWSPVLLGVLAGAFLVAHGRVESWALLLVGGMVLGVAAVLARTRLLAIVRPVAAARP